MPTNSFVGDLKFGCSPAAGYARLMEGRWESFKGARRACTGAVVTFARTVEPIPVALRYDCTVVLVLVLRVLAALETSHILYRSVVAL